MSDIPVPERIVTPRLVLRKSRYEDWRELYENVWSRAEAARYMLWSVTPSEEAAKARMLRTLEFERTHPYKYIVEEKQSGSVIGWAGVERLADGVWGETGIALSPDRWRRGYGREIVQALVSLCRDTLGAKLFIYSARRENTASAALARSSGFAYERSETRSDEAGEEYVLDYYRREL